MCEPEHMVFDIKSVSWPLFLTSIYFNESGMVLLDFFPCKK